MEERVNITVRNSKSLALREFLEKVIDLTKQGYVVDTDATSGGYPRSRSNGNVFSTDMVLSDVSKDLSDSGEVVPIVEEIDQAAIDVYEAFSLVGIESVGDVLADVEDQFPEVSGQEPAITLVEDDEAQPTLEGKLAAIEAASKKVDVLALAKQWNFDVPAKLKRPTQIQAFLRKAIKQD